MESVGGVKKKSKSNERRYGKRYGNRGRSSFYYIRDLTESQRSGKAKPEVLVLADA